MSSLIRNIWSYEIVGKLILFWLLSVLKILDRLLEGLELLHLLVACKGLTYSPCGYIC
jgi:hypothetical protein